MIYRLTQGITPAREGQWLMGRPGKPRCLVLSNLMVVRERSALSHGSTEAHGNGSRRQEVPVAVLHHKIRGTRC